MMFNFSFPNWQANYSPLSTNAVNVDSGASLHNEASSTLVSRFRARIKNMKLKTVCYVDNPLTQTRFCTFHGTILYSWFVIQAGGPDIQQPGSEISNSMLKQCIPLTENLKQYAMLGAHENGCILPGSVTKTAVCKNAPHCYRRSDVHWKEFQVTFETSIGNYVYFHF
jgi:hypothetical protein